MYRVLVFNLIRMCTAVINIILRSTQALLHPKISTCQIRLKLAHVALLLFVFCLYLTRAANIRRRFLYTVNSSHALIEQPFNASDAHTS